MTDKEITPWIPREDPIRAKYRPLTIPYNLPAEREMLLRVEIDMMRGRIPYILVGTAHEAELWRSTVGYRTGAPSPFED